MGELILYSYVNSIKCMYSNNNLYLCALCNVLGKLTSVLRSTLRSNLLENIAADVRIARAWNDSVDVTSVS